ncbi:MAG TPA: hypothetical protein VFB35_01750 [Gaiellaceae bacterium]|nr:hypothetical protein [Gaiellaceae bacterium]
MRRRLFIAAVVLALLVLAVVGLLLQLVRRGVPGGRPAAPLPR